jgi:2-polyprenyl-3-methyl-5-hydroxy-6-metoxy-1,4-benzoquinol methylase
LSDPADLAGRPAARRFQSLPADAPRDVWFAALRDAIAEYYLSEPDNPYRGSGRGKGAARFEETRRCIALAVHRDGAFMDVGCANGLLLESLVRWCGERGHRIVPHGIDFVPELVRLAQARHPAHAANFEVRNAFYWEPRRRYDFVRTNLEFVQPHDRAAFVRRLFERAVAPGGRLILCHYSAPDDPLVDCAAFLAREGFAVSGRAAADGVSVAWSSGRL